MSANQFAGIRQADQKDLRQCWQTPPDLFDALHGIFGFSVDACASAENAQLPRFWTEIDDAFSQDWSAERVFCNPPFRRCRDAARKAKAARLAVLVVPVTALSSRYLHEHRPGHILLPARRIAFLPPAGFAGSAGNLIPTALVLYRASRRHLKQLGRLGSVYRSEAPAT